MKIIVTLILVSIVVYVGYEYVRIEGLISKTKVLIANTSAYSSDVGSNTLLVIGDSTAVGVGASSPKDSLPALVGNYIGASVENHAVSGAVTSDMEAQLHEAQQSRYDMILIQVGANDIVGIDSLDAVNNQMQTLLADAQGYSSDVVLITAGRVGDAPIFPIIIKPYLNSRAAELRSLFAASAASSGALYVDLSGAASDPFDNDPSKYYAADMFHPSSAGYALWFASAKDAISVQWPNLVYGG
jgi:lysophospholipase L1-like esterase